MQELSEQMCVYKEWKTNLIDQYSFIMDKYYNQEKHYHNSGYICIRVKQD